MIVLTSYFLKSLLFQIKIFDLPQTDIITNENIRIFSGLKKKNLADGVENMSLLEIYILHLIICALN